MGFSLRSLNREWWRQLRSLQRAVAIHTLCFSSSLARLTVSVLPLECLVFGWGNDKPIIWAAEISVNLGHQVMISLAWSTAVLSRRHLQSCAGKYNHNATGNRCLSVPEISSTLLLVEGTCFWIKNRGIPQTYTSNGFTFRLWENKNDRFLEGPSCFCMSLCSGLASCIEGGMLSTEIQ